MASRRTRERILETSLALFNSLGEPNVTTNHIADELEISPGNLYYHFRNKENIVEHIFARYETRMDQALLLPDDRAPDIEDLWLQLHLTFECMWDYRFLYRDLVDILSRNRKLKMHFARLLRRAAASKGEILRALADCGVLRASAEEIHASAENVVLLSTFWLNFSAVGGARGEAAFHDPTEKSLAQGISRAMLLIAPLLREGERAHLQTLAQAYRG